MAYRLSTLLGLKLQDDDEFASIVPTANNFETVDAAIAADRARLSAIETPSVTAATTLTTIESGNTFAVILGKVKKLITDFLAHVGAGGTAHAAASTTTAGFMSAADKTKLDGIDTDANKYTHPTATAKSSGLYKITVDGTGHVSAATAVQKSDITALGIPGSATSYSNATQSAAGLMSATDKTKLDGMGKVTIPDNGYEVDSTSYGQQQNASGIQAGNIIIGYVTFPENVKVSGADHYVKWKLSSGWKIAAAFPRSTMAGIELKSFWISDSSIDCLIRPSSDDTSISNIIILVILEKTV